MNREQPLFVTRGGEQIYRQPFDALGVEYYGFLLDADTQAIQTRLCDRYLNEPSGGTLDFAPFGPWFLLVFNNLASLASSEPPDSDKGWFAERESATWVLLEERRSGNPYWFLPYILVDNSYALCMGRETYGFPKSLGRFEVPYFPDYATYFGVDTVVVPTWTPSTRGIWKTLWEVVREPNRHQSLSLTGDVQELLKLLKQAATRFETGPGKFLELLELLWKREVPMVFLKQFPSVEDSTLACYQAIVETPIKMTRFHGGSPLGSDFRATFHPYDSHPVGADFGLRDGPLTPLLGFYANFDFHISNGTVLWEAPRS